MNIALVAVGFKTGAVEYNKNIAISKDDKIIRDIGFVAKKCKIKVLSIVNLRYFWVLYSS